LVSSHDTWLIQQFATLIYGQTACAATACDRPIAIAMSHVVGRQVFVEELIQICHVCFCNLCAYNTIFLLV
jgi:hypothetical protein